jgi:uncharacterized Tic20 family protein
MALETCPRCSNKLGSPLRSGRQVCMRCAWSDQPKDVRQIDDVPVDLPPAPRPSSTRPSSTRPSSTNDDDQTRKQLSVLAHASVFFSIISFGIALVVPIVLWAASKDWIVRQNAKEVLNLQISLFLYTTIFFFLLSVIPFAPFLLVPLIFFLSFLCPIFAIIHCLGKPDISFTYPLILHLIP